ncbi:MAG TPA: CHAT domain-containing tetratricopeptide repeat protein [Vicinamibacterales bacterium]
MKTHPTVAVLSALAAVVSIAGNDRTAPARPQTSQPAAVQPLAQGQPIARTLSRSETHIYTLSLGAHQYAAVTVAQHGIDLLVRVVDDGDRTIANFDSENRPDGHARLGIVADQPTTFRIGVGAEYPKEAAGRYDIQVVEQRAARDQDVAVFEAHKYLAEANRLDTAGKYADALVSAEGAYEQIRKSAAPKSGFEGYLLTRLAEIRRTSGKLSDAEQTFMRALDVNTHVLGRDDPRTAFTMLRLAAFYNATDDYRRAEPLATESLAIAEGALGPTHPRIVTFLIVVALVHQRVEDYQRAVPELERALAIAERAFEGNDFRVLSVVNNLGDFYSLLHDYGRAVPMLTRSLQGIEHTFGPDHPNVAVPLGNLGIIAREQKDYPRALEMLTRAEAIREKSLGLKNPLTASSMINIGNVYIEKGDYAEARARFQRALELLEESAGPYHRLTMMAVTNLARAYAAEGNMAQALQYQHRADAIVEKNVSLNLVVGSERAKLAYFESIFERLGSTVSYHVWHAAEDRAAAEMAATVVLQRKGRVFDALSGSLAALRQRMDTGDQTALDQLSATSSELATLVVNGPGKRPFPEYQQTLATLDARRERLEEEISGRSLEFHAQLLPVTLQSITAAIPPDAALLEFAVYKVFDAASDDYGQARYVVYILRRGSEVRWRDLGPASEVDDLVGKLRSAFRERNQGDARQLARTVDEKVLQPLRPLVGDASHLIVSPDGSLSLIPFEALLDEKGRYEVVRYAITYLASGRDLLRMQLARSSPGAPAIVANPSFGEPRSTGTNGSRAASAVSGNALPSEAGLPDMYFAPLHGTAAEARMIHALFPEAAMLTGPAASKAALTGLAAPRILHIATHGFFLSDRPDPTTKTAPGIPNPLLRSGLALAGANAHNASDDGILTALEASALNLWGTRLVTLSACDTGVGEVRNGEGVYGLRRAFFLAGAETVVMSLWPVGDRLTREMMTAYYEGLKRGLGRGEALRQAELEMMKRPGREHPFYWASFIQAGDWRPLDSPR